MSNRTDTDEWIEWKGGECPVAPTTLVHAKRRDGHLEPEICWADEPDGLPAKALRWTHHNHDTDIIAYRVVQS